MFDQRANDIFAPASLAILTLAGLFLSWVLVGLFGDASWLGCGIIMATLILLYIPLRLVERRSRLRHAERNWAMAGEKVAAQEALEKLEETYSNTLQAIALAIDSNDSYANGHAARVAGVAIKIGKALLLSDADLKSLEKAALLHDIGKIWIPDYVLHKETQLTADERTLIRKHPVVAAELLDASNSLKREVTAVLHHHERFDGSGYPYGLKGLAIPIEARIIAVADAFDAMTSERPFRSALLMREALDELYSNAGAQFDPRVVEAFLNVLDDISKETEKVARVEKHFGARLYSMVGNC